MKPITTALGITEQNLYYYLGRFIKVHMPEESMCDAVAKIVLFRKLGCSSIQVEALLSGDDETYKEVQKQNTRGNNVQKATVLARLQGITLNALSYKNCSALLQKSGLISVRLPQDRFFYGRILDRQNFVVLFGVAFENLIFFHDSGWKSVAFALLWGLLFAFVAILSNSELDWRRFKREFCR